MSTEHHVRKSGRVIAMAWRPTDSEPMIETDEQEVVAGAGFTSEPGRSTARGLTLLSVESWGDTCRELGVELPWRARRANLLVEGLDLGKLIGQTVSIGTITLRVNAETKPCNLMDKEHPGLRKALIPAFRGGVFGEVTVGGVIKVNDAVTALNP
jgi:MOSC domain-containing protein YiiM